MQTKVPKEIHFNTRYSYYVYISKNKITQFIIKEFPEKITFNIF